MNKYSYAVVYSFMYIDIFDSEEEAIQCLADICEKNGATGGWIEKHLKTEIEDNEDG